MNHGNQGQGCITLCKSKNGVFGRLLVGYEATLHKYQQLKLVLLDT